jgi:PIN domain nuclease of toxin-antitoxin system
LYDGLVDLLSPAASARIEEGRLLVSPMVELELTLLRDIGRIRPKPSAVLSALARDIGLQMSEISFRETIGQAKLLDWTRDPFDRVIVGEALAAGAMLVTKDRSILANCTAAVW